MTRPDAARRFVAAQSWEDATVSPLAGDASNRRYERLRKPDGSIAVLMDAPPEKGEDIRPFVQIAKWLGDQGLSAPKIIAEDETKGFLLIEDLGDRLFAREMAKDASLQEPLYSAAVDALVVAHAATPPDLPKYNAAVSVPLAGLAFDWYLQGASGAPKDAAKERFCDAFKPVIQAFDTELDVLIQRDFHAENLLWLPERKGVARVGLLDFQDAMVGHRAYDLVSVLQDARRDVPPTVCDTMIRRYLDASAVAETRFRTAFAVFGLQRNLRILGVFARLCLRDGKADYVDLIPRVWAHVEINLGDPALRALQPRVTDVLPPPTDAVLDALKRKCGSWAGR